MESPSGDGGWDPPIPRKKQILAKENISEGGVAGGAARPIPPSLCLTPSATRRKPDGWWGAPVAQQATKQEQGGMGGCPPPWRSGWELVPELMRGGWLASLANPSPHPLAASGATRSRATVAAHFLASTSHTIGRDEGDAPMALS